MYFVHFAFSLLFSCCLRISVRSGTDNSLVSFYQLTRIDITSFETADVFVFRRTSDCPTVAVSSWPLLKIFVNPSSLPSRCPDAYSLSISHCVCLPLMLVPEAGYETKVLPALPHSRTVPACGILTCS
jgi:hypothetical protein